MALPSASLAASSSSLGAEAAGPRGCQEEDGEQLEALLTAVPASQPARPWARRTACAAAWAAAAGAGVLLLAMSAGTGQRLLPGAATPVAAPAAGAAAALELWDASAAAAAAEGGLGLLEGSWAYGKYGLYHISRDAQGRWGFQERLSTGEEAEGGLRPSGGWLEGNLSTPGGEFLGQIRLRRGAGGTLVSNYAPAGQGGGWSASEDVVAQAASEDYYVLLEVFRLEGSGMLLGGLYHSQMAICPKEHFSADERAVLDSLPIDSSHDFSEVPPSLWRRSSAACGKLGYGGSGSTGRCSGVGTVEQALSWERALIPNVDEGAVWKYLYGTGHFSARQVADRLCLNRCGDQWSGASYGLVENNCNTFTSTILHCEYGLSQAKPNLGISDLRTVSCRC